MSKEKDQHVNVFVRVKPLSEKEISDKCSMSVQVASDKEIIVYERSQEKVAKKFTFDRVFGPASSQVDVYKTVVSPLLKEVLAGYNCTVFAYGQTGTGKTYTMEGDRVENPNLHWQSDTSAGMIPRCLSHLFDELQTLENQRYVVRVNFLELYNEELFDLLSPSGSDAAKIKLYEDTSKRGSVIIHGLEEVTVRNKTEVYKILEKGSERRQTAATLMNANSSRSHTVFSITIHTKENTDNGEELLKTAKLNLVDLAGSENVGKSGAVDKRARETRNINQSLLTLGRVITALVEKAPHVPYRESKLTRLLQESLGGRTKTSIIATVSSAGSNVDETQSTLDYAHRAKHITNRPEINQKLYKRALLKEYTEELERLRKDLIATREKNGIYLSRDKYDSMHELIKWQRKEIQKRINDFKTLEEEMENKKKIFNDIQSQYDAQKDELTTKTSELSDLMSSLQSTEDFLKQIEYERDEQKYFVERYVETEKILCDQTKTLLDVVDEATADAQKLRDKLDFETKAEEENEKVGLQMRDNFTEHVKNIKDDLANHTKQQIEHFFLSIKNDVETQIAAQAKNMETLIFSNVRNIIYKHSALTEQSENNISTSYAYYPKLLNKNMQDTSAVVEYEKHLSNAICSKLAPEINDLLKDNESFVQNLQTLNNSVSRKLEDASTYTRDVIELICRNQLEEYNNLRKDLSEISEHINCMFLNEKQVAKNYKAFAKKMEDLSRELTLLNKCEKIYSESADSSHQINEACNKIDNQSLQNYKTYTNAYKDLKEATENSISQIKRDIDSNVNQAQVFSEIAIEKSDILVNDLAKRLSAGCATLKQHNNNAEFRAQQLQKRMAEDKGKLVTSNTMISKMFENMDCSHAKFMKQQQNKILDFSTALDDKLTTQGTELSNWNDKTVEELKALQQQVDKFLTKDGLRRDVSTGATPPRKEFSYPRQFTTTSPREQLIQRFRESRCLADYIDRTNDSDPTSMNKSASNKRLSTSNASTNSAGISDRVPYATSTPYKSSDANHSSTSDILDISKKSTPSNSSKMSISTSHSETENDAEDTNKENINFIKPKTIKNKKLARATKERRRIFKLY